MRVTAILLALTASATASPIPDPPKCLDGAFAVRATPLEVVTDQPPRCSTGPQSADGDTCVSVWQNRACDTSVVTVDGAVRTAELIDEEAAPGKFGDHVELRLCDVSPGVHRIGVCFTPAFAPLQCEIDKAADAGAIVMATRDMHYEVRVRVDEVLVGPASWRGTERTIKVAYGCDTCPLLDPTTRDPLPIPMLWTEDAEIPVVEWCTDPEPGEPLRVTPSPRGCGCDTGGDPGFAVLALIMFVVLARRPR